MYDIQQISNKNVWNSEIIKYPYTNILNSFEWGDFKRNQGSQVEFWIVKQGQEIKALIAPELIKAKRGIYLNIANGPVLDWHDQKLAHFVLTWLKKYSHEQKAWFTRISPLISTDFRKLLQEHRFKVNKHSVNARHTIYIDLRYNNDTLLKNMRKNTRYSIRKALKDKNIQIDIYTDLTSWETFKTIYLETLKQKRWKASSVHYIRQQFRMLSKLGYATMFVGKINNIPVTAAIFTSFGQEVIYHHSGMLQTARKTVVMYKLLWKAIQYYKDLKFNRLNLYGVLPRDKMHINNSMYGVSLFKYGFGGDYKKFINDADFILSPLAYIPKVIEDIEFRLFT